MIIVIKCINNQFPNRPDNICSSIVGGIPSIASGIALSIKLQNKKDRVWCWVGDMSAETGHFHEAYKYSLNHDLPITFIVEDNKKSVCTPTPDIWKRETPYYLNSEYKGGIQRQKNLIYYQIPHYFLDYL